MQMSDIDVQGLLLIPVLTGVFALVCYIYARLVRRGKKVTSTQKKMITYASLFCLGMGFAMILNPQLQDIVHWNHAWIAATLLWVAFLSSAGWAFSRHPHS